MKRRDRIEEQPAWWFSTDRGVEGLIVVGIVGALVAFAISGSFASIPKVRMTEVVMLVSAARTDAMEHRALTGQWPDADPAGHLSGVKQPPPSGEYVSTIQPGEQGRLDFTMTDAFDVPGGHISVRPATLPGVAESPVVWLCGNAVAGPFEPAASNATDIPEARLPAACRRIVRER